MPFANTDKNYLEALAAMHPSDVFALACSRSNKETDDLLKELGWSKHFLRRVLGPEEFYPSYARLPHFCNVTRSTLPLDWLAARIKFEPEEPEALTLPVLLARVNDVTVRMGKLAQTTQESIADGILEHNELRQLTRDVLQLTREGMFLAGQLRQAERLAAKEKGEK